MVWDGTVSPELVPGLPYSEFVVEAFRHVREKAFRASPFFSRHGEAIERLLTTPWVHARPAPSGGPAPESGHAESVRLVHWNI